MRRWQTREAGVHLWLLAAVGGRDVRSTREFWGAAGHRCDDGHDRDVGSDGDGLSWEEEEEEEEGAWWWWW